MIFFFLICFLLNIFIKIGFGDETSAAYWEASAQRELRKQLMRDNNNNTATNTIFFLGDGMSIPTITAARIYLGQLRGRRGEESKLSFEKFPYMGLSKVNAGLCHLLFLLTCVVLCLIQGVDGSNSYTSF